MFHVNGTFIPERVRVNGTLNFAPQRRRIDLHRVSMRSSPTDALAPPDTSEPDLSELRCFPHLILSGKMPLIPTDSALPVVRPAALCHRVRMSISWNRSLKTGLATAGAATAFAALVPSTASADIVDEALAMVPEGQISCAQANQYWTTEAEYNGYVQQARGVAAFHPRGGEINEALARIDEAADRCGLKGGAVAVQETGAATNGQAATAVNAYVDDTGGAAIDQDAYDTDDGQNPGGQTTTPPPVETGGGEAPADSGPVYTVPVPEAIPTTTVTIADIGAVVVPDAQQIIEDVQAGNPLAQLTAGSSN